jgi:hypothetical protein
VGGDAPLLERRKIGPQGGRSQQPVAAGIEVIEADDAQRVVLQLEGKRPLGQVRHRDRVVEPRAVLLADRLHQPAPHGAVEKGAVQESDGARIGIAREPGKILAAERDC